MKVTFEIPGLLPSRSNLRVHWARLARLARSQRGAARGLALMFTSHRFLAAARKNGCSVQFVRVAPRLLDDDNLASACKSLRDGVADALRMDDRDPRISWSYAQEAGNPPAVLVTIETRAPGVA